MRQKSLVILYLFYLIFSGKRRKQVGERKTYLLFHLFMHSLVDLVCALTGDRTSNHGVLRQCSNQLSYLARAIGQFLLFIYLLLTYFERERERKHQFGVPLNLHTQWLLLVCALPDWRSNPKPWYIGTTLQPMDLPGQGHWSVFQLLNPRNTDK